MQYHLIVMVLAEYSSGYSLFAFHMMLATSILTLLKTIVQLVLHSPCILAIIPINDQGGCDPQRVGSFYVLSD